MLDELPFRTKLSTPSALIDSASVGLASDRCRIAAGCRGSPPRNCGRARRPARKPRRSSPKPPPLAAGAENSGPVRRFCCRRKPFILEIPRRRRKCLDFCTQRARNPNFRPSIPRKPKRENPRRKRPTPPQENARKRPTELEDLKTREIRLGNSGSLHGSGKGQIFKTNRVPPRGKRSRYGRKRSSKFYSAGRRRPRIRTFSAEPTERETGRFSKRREFNLTLQATSHGGERSAASYSPGLESHENALKNFRLRTTYLKTYLLTSLPNLLRLFSSSSSTDELAIGLPKVHSVNPREKNRVSLGEERRV